MTWAEAARRVDELAHGLLALGVSRGDRVAILGPSTVDWALLDFAALSIGAAVVPIYPTSSQAEVAYILENADLIGRRGRGRTRLVAFGACYVAAEAAMIVTLFVLWIGSAFGLLLRTSPLRSAHYGLLRAWLRVVSAAAVTLLGLRIEILDPPEPRPGPLLVFGRHAGPGNSLMMIRTLMLRFARRPRVVMLAFLQWDPVIDIVAHRLPSLFIEHDPERSDEFLARIGALAGGLGDEDALLIYPEGHDFTERIRLRAIAHLRRKGHHHAAARAESWERVLPPRHKGPLAAVRAARDADVVLVAHTALEEVGSFADLHRRLPFDRPIKARYWRIPAADVPREAEPLIAWLFDWWQRIDNWIDEHAPPADA